MFPGYCVTHVPGLYLPMYPGYTTGLPNER